MHSCFSVLLGCFLIARAARTQARKRSLALKQFTQKEQHTLNKQMISLLGETDTDVNCLSYVGKGQRLLVEIGDSKNASLLLERVQSQWVSARSIEFWDNDSLASAQKVVFVEYKTDLKHFQLEHFYITPPQIPTRLDPKTRRKVRQIRWHIVRLCEQQLLVG